MATNNSINSTFTNNSDGFLIGGGTTPRTLTITSGNITLTGGGSNTFTFPAASDTLVGRSSTDTLTNKTITTGSNTIQGLVSNRQGGTTGVASWYTAGTSNTSLTGTTVFMQVGSVFVNAASVTITFPTAFNQVPLVFATIETSTTSNGFGQVTAVTATQATIRVIGFPGGTATTITTENVSWLAIGQ